MHNDSLVVSSVDWNSSAWKAGIRKGNVILEVDEKPASEQNIGNIIQDKKTGDKVHLNILRKGGKHPVDIVLGTKSERSFTIKPMEKPDKLQAAILKSWVK